MATYDSLLEYCCKVYLVHFRTWFFRHVHPLHNQFETQRFDCLRCYTRLYWELGSVQSLWADWPFLSQIMWIDLKGWASNSGPSSQPLGQLGAPNLLGRKKNYVLVVFLIFEFAQMRVLTSLNMFEPILYWMVDCRDHGQTTSVTILQQPSSWTGTCVEWVFPFFRRSPGSKEVCALCSTCSDF